MLGDVQAVVLEQRRRERPTVGRVPDDLGVDAHVASAGVERVVLANSNPGEHQEREQRHAPRQRRGAFRVPRSAFHGR